MKNILNKKSNKRMAALLVILLFIVRTAPIVTSADNADKSFEYGDFYYKILEDGTLSVIWYSGSDSYIEIPEKVNGMEVSTLGGSIFSYNTTLTEVKLPKTLKVIEALAFYGCTNLKKISIPEGVTKINSMAFYGCEGLSDIEFHEGLEYIGEFAFMLCKSLSRVGLPDSVLKIDNQAFAYCEMLQHLTLPKNLVAIGNYAFVDCENFLPTNVLYIPDGLTEIGEGAFEGCDGLTVRCYENSSMYKYAVENGLDYVLNDGTVKLSDDYEYQILDNGSVMILSYREVEYGKDVIIPSEIDGRAVTCIGKINNEGYVQENAFKYSSVSSVIIPENVTTIGDGAFHMCSNLSKVTLPESLTTIGAEAFWICPELEEIDIPDSVTTIGADAFNSDINLKNVHLPLSLEIIESGTFCACTSLTDIDIPDSVKKIKSDAFSFCSQLTELTVPNTVADIEDNAFSGCELLVIKCYRNSCAHKYAIKNDINYELIDTNADYVLGDVNSDGNITAIDARLILQNAAGNYEFDETVKIAADVNRDEKVTAIDARLVLQAAAGNVVLD